MLNEVFLFRPKLLLLCLFTFSASKSKGLVVGTGWLVNMPPFFLQDIEVGPFKSADPNRQYISGMVLDVDFYSKKKVTTEMYNSDEMAKEFLMQFANQVLDR